MERPEYSDRRFPRRHRRTGVLRQSCCRPDKALQCGPIKRMVPSSDLIRRDDGLEVCACFRGTSFAGFVQCQDPFGRQIPKACPTGAVNLVHYHGRDDPIVPLHGRPIKDAHQGDVFEAVELMTRTGEYRSLADNGYLTWNARAGQTVHNTSWNFVSSPESIHSRSRTCHVLPSSFCLINWRV